MRSAEKIIIPDVLVTSFDVEAIRKDFPILQREIKGKPLVYLDNAATSQKPRVVIETLVKYYLDENSNIHRGVHYLSDRATHAYEAARLKAQRFLNAAKREEIIFVRGTTEAVNLVAQSFAKRIIGFGDEVLISTMEHHSNIVPWQMICQERGARLRVIPINDAGELILEEFESLLTPRTRILALTHVSNALGTINPIKEMISKAHRNGTYAFIDGAQAVPHMKVDVQELNCDFYAFSSHKMFGPTGVGILYGKAHLLEGMPPYQGGGDMIKTVTFEKTIYSDPPFKFEAGTPNIAGGIGLGVAIDYLQLLDRDAAFGHEDKLLEYATETLGDVDGLRIIGTARRKAGVISFVLDGIHPHDIGTIFDDDGIAIRTGHHCAQPLMKRFGVPATARASFAFYNTYQEVDKLVTALRKVKEILR